MKHIIFLSLFLIATIGVSQTYQSLDTVNAPTAYDNLYVRSLNNDSLVSSFVVIIKKEVKLHKHQTHAEHVYVLEGEGDMRLGDKNIHVKKGDLVFIPKNTAHSLKVTSAIPVKVISVQAPNFDGKDRVFIE